MLTPEAMLHLSGCFSEVMVGCACRNKRESLSYFGELANLQVKADDENIPGHPHYEPGCVLQRGESESFHKALFFCHN